LCNETAERAGRRSDPEHELDVGSFDLCTNLVIGLDNKTSLRASWTAILA